MGPGAEARPLVWPSPSLGCDNSAPAAARAGRLEANVRFMERFDAEVTVRRTRFASAQTGWAVVEAADGEGAPVVLVGPLVHLEDRERVRISGEWVQDERYGLQVKVAQAVPVAPTDAETLSAYLCRVRHIGPRRAARLIDHFGPEVIDAVDADPPGAFAAVGLRASAASEAQRAWERLRVTRRLHLLLEAHDFCLGVTQLRTD